MSDALKASRISIEDTAWKAGANRTVSAIASRLGITLDELEKP